MDLEDFDDGKDHGKIGMLKIGCPADLGAVVHELVHHTIKMAPSHGENGMESAEIASAAMMGAALDLALIVCKKPKGLPVEGVSKEKALEALLALRAETVVFASLLAANQFEGTLNNGNGQVGMECRFGEHAFGRALAQWQKLYPDLNIEDYLEEAVVDIARKALNNPENHNFNVEKEFNRAFMLKNNGSIN